MGTPISSLPAADALTGAELVPVVQDGLTKHAQVDSFTSSVIPYTPAGTSAVPATAQSKMREIVSVEDFGAVGDGIADDTLALQRAFDYAATKGIATVCGTSGRTYRCGQITAACGVNFDGRSCTIIATSESWLLISGGISYSSSRISSVTVKATLAPTVGSVGIGFTSSAFLSRRGIEIEDVTFAGNDGLSLSAFGFEKYVLLTNASYPRLDNVRVDGCYNPLKTGPGFSQFVSYGCALEGQTVGALILHCRWQAVHTGVIAPSYQQEGINIISNEAVGVRDGYNLRSGATIGGPGVWLINCHANASRKSFDLGFRTDISLAGCTAYKAASLIEEDWTGYDLEGVYGASLVSCSAIYNDLASSAISKAVRCLNSQGVSGSALTLRQSKIALSHEGGCIGCTWEAISFLGSGTYADKCISVANTDQRIRLGQHSILSTWATPYDIADNAASTFILARGNYRVTRTAELISAAATKVLTAGVSSQYQRIGLAAGADAYDYTLELSLTGAILGDYFDFYVNLPSLADRRLLIKSGVGGSTILTLAVAASRRFSVRCVYNGAAWEVASVSESSLSF